MTVPTEAEVQRAVVVELPLPPNRANDRSHWRKVAREKEAYYEAARVLLVNQTGPVRRKQTKAFRIRLTATLYVWSLSDPDNAVSRLKWPIDALVAHGLLYEDRGVYLDLAMPEQVIDRANPRVVMELQSVPFPKHPIKALP